MKLIDIVCRSSTKAGIRIILSCALGKIHLQSVDIRKPYTNISADSFSGRSYDERYITDFINTHELPCNSTTGYLTPSFRTKNETLTLDLDLGGRPKILYDSVLKLLDFAYKEIITPNQLLNEMIHHLKYIRNEKKNRLMSLIKELGESSDNIDLSSEDIENIIKLHLSSPGASRLPVLIVAAAYKSANKYLGEDHIPLMSHNAADKQTRSLGDVEITLIDDKKVITSYEMKLKKVLKSDIENALHKIANRKIRIDNYIFISTEKSDADVIEYAKSLYLETKGIEFVILDCIQFIHHFLHLFHRLRIPYLNAYQKYILDEPESAVSQNLKEIFLNLRIEAEKKYIE